MSLETIQNITLDFTIPKIKNVRCVQDDKNSRIINILITNNGEVYPLSKSTMVARYKIHKPDHTYIYNEVPINDDGTVTIELTEQAMAVIGIAHSELQISDSSTGNILSTMPFNIIVEKSVISNKDIESKNESDVIDGMINHLVDYNNPHRMPDATTTVKGITALTDSVTSTSTTTAATPNSVKTVNDALVAEINRATNAEQIISDSLSAEVNRATTVENNKVDKINGKGLSTNDLTDELLSIINSDHTYAGITTTSETNLNNITEPGIYRIDTTSQTYTNAPGINRFLLEVSTHTRYIVHKAFGIYGSTSGGASSVPTPTILVRSKDTILGTWSSWQLPNAQNSTTVNGHTVNSDVPSDAKFTDTTYGVASSSALGLVKSGTDITVDSSGNVSVNDNSHKHTVSNISDLTATASELNVLDGITATTTELNYTDGVTSNIQTQLNSKSAKGHTHDDRYYTESEIDTKLNAKLNTSLKGSASGLAELDANGKVPSSQLPSFVDDVIEGYFYNSKFYKETAHTTEITGETGKIYIDLSTNKTYRWSGSAFVVISETLALGETSSTAYRGDRGKTAYDHSQSTHARTDATKVEKSTTNGNIKINGTETTVYTHPSGTNPHGTTKSDVGLSNVPNVATNDQTPSYTEATSLTKLTSGEKLSVAFGKISKAITDLIAHIGDSVKHITSTERTNWNSAKTHADSTHAPSNAQANVIETVKVNGTALTPSSKAVDITVPSVGNGTITITQNGTTKGTFTTNQSGNTTIALTDNNTTYSSKSAASGGTDVSLVTTGEKYTWNNKANASHGNHVPATQTANNAVFLRNDNTWQTVTPANIGAAASSHTHSYAGSSSAGGSATSANKIVTFDTRVDNPAPNSSSFTKKSLTTDFKYVSKIGYPQSFSGEYCGLISFAPWNDSSGGNGYQFAVGYNSNAHPRLAVRSADLGATSWGSWYKIYTSDDKPSPADIGAAASSHTHSAYVNQNAFSNIAVGSTTVSADSATDTLTLVAGSNVTITPDAANDKITISSAHPTISTSTDTTSTASPSSGGTFTTVDSVIRDNNGHVTKVNTKTVTLPSTSVTVDSALSSTSTNPVQNKVIKSSIDALDYIALANSIGWKRASVMSVTYSDLGSVYMTYIASADYVANATYLIKLNNGSIHKVTARAVSSNQYGVKNGVVLVGTDVATATASGVQEDTTTGKKAWVTGASTRYTASNYAPLTMSTSSSVVAWYCKIDGTVKDLISSSSAITDAGQYALDAREKNASVSGTLANQISRHISTSASTSTLGHVKFGKSSGTACQGNDSRLSDSRTPKSHASTGTSYGAGSTSNYGHVKLTDSTAVTDSTGLALPATEKNASIEGTLANQISVLNTNLSTCQDDVTGISNFLRNVITRRVDCGPGASVTYELSSFTGTKFLLATKYSLFNVIVWSTSIAIYPLINNGDVTITTNNHYMYVRNDLTGTNTNYYSLH